MTASSHYTVRHSVKWRSSWQSDEWSYKATNWPHHKPSESAPRLYISRHSLRSWKTTPYVENTYVRPSVRRWCVCGLVSATKPCRIFIKSGKGDKKVSSKREFRENWPSDSQALFTDLNDSLPVMHIFLDRSGWYSARNISIQLKLSNCNSVKICTMKAPIYLQMQMEFCPYYVKFSTTMDKIRYGKCPQQCIVLQTVGPRFDYAVRKFRIVLKLRRRRDRAVGIAIRYGLDGPGIEFQWEARFSATVQTGPGAHLAYYTTGTGSFQGVKRPGCGVDHPPHLTPRSKKE